MNPSRSDSNSGVLFEYQTFPDDEKTWDALFVKIDDGPWHMADVHYNTEDEAEILSIIRSRKYNNSQLKNFVDFMETKGVKLNPTDVSIDLGIKWGIDLGGVSILQDDGDFEVGYEAYDSGSYWEPPSSDYVEVGSFNRLGAALFEAYALLLNMEFTNWLESQIEY